VKNLVWFCLGIVTGRGLPMLWHILYLVTIAALSIKAFSL
jgi:hypothetical protein